MGKLLLTLILIKDKVVRALRLLYKVIGEALRLIDKVEKKDDEQK